MPIKQLVLEPAINVDWSHRPLQVQLKYGNKPKLVFVNDIWLEDLQQQNGQDITMLSENNVELLLTNSMLQKNSNLKKLVESYFNLDQNTEYPFNKNTLLLFLKLLAITAVEQKKEPLLVLKNWFKITSNKLGEEFGKIKLENDSKQLHQALEVFASNPKYTEAIINFLWSIHGENKIVSGQDILSLKKTLVAPVSELKAKSYKYLLFSFCNYNKGEVFLDTNVDIALFKPLLVDSRADLYIYRYAESNDLETSYLASQASNIWSSMQNKNQSTFMAWLTNMNPQALDKYSVRDFDSITTDSPYNLYVGRYFSYKNGDLVMCSYDSKSNKWLKNKFDLFYIRKNTIEKNKVSLEEINEDLNKVLNKLSEVNTSKDNENNDSNSELKPIMELDKKLNTLSSKIDNILHDQESDNSVDNKQHEEKYYELLKDLSKKITDIQEKMSNFSPQSFIDPEESSNEWADITRSNDINKQFNDALSKQDNEDKGFIDFDSELNKD